MLLLFLQFIGAASTIFIAGTYLTRYADRIGAQTGLGRTLAGIVLLATATSLPELAVDCSFARMGLPNLAVGDLLGSSLFNLLILAILDLAHRGPTRMLSRVAAAHALSATMSIAMTALCLLFLLAPISWTLGRVGPGPILLGIFYALGLRLVYFDQHFAVEQQGESMTRPVASSKTPALHWNISGYVGAAMVILVAAPLLASAAERIAEQTGLGGTFIGTTLVAFSTSLPEFVTTMAAIRSQAYDLAVGNIFGSNAFNMVILLPVDSFYDGSLLAAAAPTHAVTAACVILVTSVAVAGLLYRPEKKFWIVEPDAALVMLLVLVSLGLVYYLR